MVRFLHFSPAIRLGAHITYFLHGTKPKQKYSHSPLSKKCVDHLVIMGR